MKNRSKRMILLSMMALVLFFVPFFVKAAEEEKQEDNAATETENDKKVKVYLFKKEGCQYCNGALTFFTELAEDKEYGQYFELIRYDIVNEQSSADLLDDIAEYLNESIDGVPFIIIGEQTYPGYDLSGGWDDEIKEVIKSEYQKDPSERVDIVQNVINGVKKEANPLVECAVVVVTIGVVVLLIYARKRNSKNK